MSHQEAAADDPSLLCGAPSSVVGPGLVPRDGGRPPLCEDLGLDGTMKAAFAWQTFRTRGQTLEIHALLNYGKHRSDWVREITGLAGMIGELVIVAMEAESEKAQLLGTPTDPTASGYAWRRRSLRFFAEGQSNYLVTTGHLLANLVLRVLALHPCFCLPEPLAKKLQLTDTKFVPFSDHREAWLSGNRTACRVMAVIARRYALPEVSALVSELGVLQLDPRWQQLEKHRGGQYHRWRTESAGIAAFDRQPSLATRLLTGEMVDFPQDEPFLDGERVVDDAAAVSRLALEALGERLQPMLDRLEPAIWAFRS